MKLIINYIFIFYILYNKMSKKTSEDNIKKFLENEKENFKKSYITKEQLDLLLKLYFDDKVIFGLGRDRIFKYLDVNYPDIKISRRQVNRFLQSLLIVQLFNPKKEPKEVGQTIKDGPFNRFEMDLLDISNMASEGYKYMFNMIDVFSKFVISKPLKTKDEKAVLEAFKSMMGILYKDYKDYPDEILSDNGAEFKNSSMNEYCRKNKIKQIFTIAENASHAKLVERWNGYIRRQIARYDKQFDNPQWTQYYQKLIYNYNNTISRITQKTPFDIIGGKTNNKVVKSNIEKAILPKNTNQSITKLKVDDVVRLQQMTGEYEKPTNNITWSNELYKVYKVKEAEGNGQTTYIIRKYPDGEIIRQYYYYDDLKKVNPDTIKNIKSPIKYIVLKIEKYKKVKKNGIISELLFIKWKGYSKKDNTWEPLEVMKVEVPKMVEQFMLKNKIK